MCNYKRVLQKRVFSFLFHFWSTTLFKSPCHGMSRTPSINLYFFCLPLWRGKKKDYTLTPWPLWALLLQAWIKPFEKEIFYINRQPSNKLLQSSLPNHLVSRSELRPKMSSISSLIPPIIFIIRCWHTRQVGRRGVGQAGRAVKCTDVHEKLFKCRGADLIEWGQFLSTQPELWHPKAYGVLWIYVPAWPLCCRHHYKLECRNWCV